MTYKVQTVLSFTFYILQLSTLLSWCLCNFEKACNWFVVLCYVQPMKPNKLYNINCNVRILFVKVLSTVTSKCSNLLNGGNFNVAIISW